MERDMRNKFFVALLLTIPTVLYSPLGMNLLGVRLPTFGLGENVIMLLLSTPVVFYCGLKRPFKSHSISLTCAVHILDDLEDQC
jgi:hypothetical protein